MDPWLLGLGAFPEVVDHHQASLAISEYIQVFYNRWRLHSTLGYMSPVAYEALHAAEVDLAA